MSYLLLFVAGALFANGIPHFVHGASGASFQTPFAKPPGVGESPPIVNVLWGFANLVGGGLLFARFAPTDWPEYATAGAGALVVAAFCATHFGKVRAAS